MNMAFNVIFRNKRFQALTLCNMYLNCGVGWYDQGLVSVTHAIMADHRGVDEPLSVVEEVRETVRIRTLQFYNVV